MFSQWRSKRHFPMDSVSSVYPSTTTTTTTTSNKNNNNKNNNSSSSSSSSSRSQSTTPIESDFAHISNRHNPPPPPSSSSAIRSAGVKAKSSRVAIGKGAKFRPGTREGGTRSPMSFAAGPRSTSRGANSLEFGGGVVPDDCVSEEADGSDSCGSPVTPQYITSKHGTATQIGATAPSHSASVSVPSSNGKSAHLGADRDASSSSSSPNHHARLESIGTLGSFEDFRSLIAFSSPSNLLDQSPALTMSTDYSSPDFPASAAVATKDKPLPVVIADKPQPPIPVSSQPEMLTSSSSQQTISRSHPMRTPPKRVAVKVGSSSADEPVHLRPTSIGGHRRSTASSLPESVSNPGSSQMASEEFHSPSRSTSTTDAMRRLEESVREGSASTATFGLGITSPDDAQPTASTTTPHRPSIPTQRTSTSTSTRRHTKSSSEISGHSSADSWGRTSFGRDALRMLIDSEPHDSQKPASLASSKTQKTYISDSGHSTNTAETSNDVHDSDQLSTIKERTESPSIAESSSSSSSMMLKRQISMDSGFSQSQSQNADFSDARTSRTSASSLARSMDGFRTGSPESRFTVRTQGGMQQSFGGGGGGGRAAETHQQAGGGGGINESRVLLSAQSQSSVNGIGSPTFGFSRQRKISQSSMVTELLPPLELDATATKAHARSTSNASSTHTRTAPSDLSAIAGLRRGSAGVLSTSTSPRVNTEPYTAPLPSHPFPASASTPLLPPTFTRTPIPSSEPNTPNLIYEAALAKAVGKQRKNRPAALALNLTSLSAFSPNAKTSGAGATAAAAVLSPNNITFKGLASPGKPRVPPPSAPPTEPLPPIPNTPSLAPPKSPNPMAAAAARVDAMCEDVDPLRTPKGTPQGKRASQISQNRSSSGSSGSLVVVRKRDAPGSDGLKQKSVDAEEKEAGSPAVEEVTTSVLPLVVATEEGSDGVKAPTQPAMSLSKKEVSNKDEVVMVTAASASQPADAPAATSATKAPLVDSTAMKPEQIVQPSPAAMASRQILNLEPRRPTFTTSSTTTRVPPSAWNTRNPPSSTHHEPPTHTTTTAKSDFTHDATPRDGALSVASNHSTHSLLSDRRLEILHSKNLDPTSHLKRTETRFAGAFSEIAHAFRQLQADKLLLEQIVREKTPLTGVGVNNVDLANYLTTLNAKVENSNGEIRKLLDLLEQQREVIEQLLATHQLEKETYAEDVERLHCALDDVHAELDAERAKVARLNEELSRAHAGMVEANKDSMRVKMTLEEEARRREKVVGLLRLAKERLKEVESEQQRVGELVVTDEEEEAEEQLVSVGGGGGKREARGSMGDESEVVMLRRMLEERDVEIAALKLSHADAVMRETTPATSSTSEVDEAAQPSSSTNNEELTALRNQLQTQKEREKHIRSAYLFIREELRKANVERRRSSISSLTTTPTTTTTTTPNSAASSSTSASWVLSNNNPRISRAGFLEHLRTASTASNGETTTTPVKLKRLSLPIVARVSGAIPLPPPPPPPPQQDMIADDQAQEVLAANFREAHVGHNKRHSKQQVVTTRPRVNRWRSNSPPATG